MCSMRAFKSTRYLSGGAGSLGPGRCFLSPQRGSYRLVYSLRDTGSIIAHSTEALRQLWQPAAASSH